MTPPFSVEIEDEWGTKMFVATTAVENERSGHFAAGEQVVFCVEFENHLAPGKYYPTVNVSQARRGSRRDPSRATDVDHHRVRLDRSGRSRRPSLRSQDRAPNCECRALAQLNAPRLQRAPVSRTDTRLDAAEPSSGSSRAARARSRAALARFRTPDSERYTSPFGAIHGTLRSALVRVRSVPASPARLHP